MERELTTRQAAKAIGVSEASIKRWCDKGLIPCEHTLGGHRRLSSAGVIQFLRQSGRELTQPELLGVPSARGRRKAVLERAAGQMADALQQGDAEGLRRIGFDLYLAGHPAWEIFDHALAAAFRAVGNRWQHGRLEIFQERRGCEICMHFLHELREAVPSPCRNAPRAIGGTLAGDQYTLAAHMAEIVLREDCWRAECYGVALPACTWCAAIEQIGPHLVWLSVSWIDSVQRFREELSKVYQCARRHGAAVIVGGRALTDSIRQQVPYSAYGDNFQHLAAFAETLWRRPPMGGGDD